MCQAFANAGHDVTLFARPGETVGNVFEFYGVTPNFEVVTTAARGSRRIREWTHAALTARKLNRRTFDLIYGRSLPALATAARGDTPFIYEAHQPASLTGRVVEHVLFRRDNLVQCVFISESLRRAYLERFAQLRQVETLVAHDATNVAPMKQQEANAEPKSERLRVGYCGSFYPGRGIEIICALARHVPEFEFHMCGGSTDEVNKCKALVSGCRNMKFQGFLPPAHTQAWQESMDVLVAPYQMSVPTVEWMSPLKVFEYMATGKAIIASDLPALREILEDGSNALLVPASDIRSWADALRRLSDARLRTALGQHAVNDVRESYTWDLRAQAVLSVLPVSATAA